MYPWIDFYSFSHNPAERLKYWKKAVDMRKKMVKEFVEAVASRRRTGEIELL